MIDHDLIKVLAESGAGLTDAQLALASTTASEALGDPWALGYCFAVFDALGQRANLAQNPDSTLLLIAGFQRLLADRHAAADKLSFAIDNQKDAAFQHGSRLGGTEIYAWLSEEKTPTGLAFRLNKSRDAKPN